MAELVARSDVIVVGAGQAAVPLVKKLVAAGKTVVLIERGELGGTCVNDGCTPTKTMIASARAAQVARTARRLGVRTGEVSVDLAAIVDRKDAMVRRSREHLADALAKLGNRFRRVKGEARFVAPRTLAVNGERLGADVVVLDVGQRPFVPNIPGLDSVPFLDNRAILSLRQLPAHLAVLGGGTIGCELGQMFRRFGSEVTIVDHSAHLLAREDPEVSLALELALGGEGVHLELSTKVERVARRAGDRVVLHLSTGKELVASHVLVATGRTPNTDTLGCEQAGVRLDARGFIVVDDGFATSAPGVYAVGDVNGGPQFTHTAWDDHRLLYDRLRGRATIGRSARIVPFAVFTDPEVAGVGFTEREARAAGLAFEVASIPFANIARASEIDETAGLIKLLVDPSDRRVIGARIVGAQAGELVHVLSILMQAGASLDALVDGEVVHPTLVEGLQSAAMLLPAFAID
jgi:pyruvate/2-oxoglutarate dehydrogenase complex dihydrolipoamide dehydrogenase (E3) component